MAESRIDRVQQIDRSILYVDIMEETLEKKDRLLADLINLTKKQQEALTLPEKDYDVIDDLVSEKEELIQDVLEIDDGFQALYEKVKYELAENKGKFQDKIQSMQSLIKKIVEKGIQIKGLEARNKVLFDQYIKEERGKIGDFKKNNAAATAYYRNMANLQLNESYFLDKKK